METFGNKIKQKSPKIQQSEQDKTIQFCTNCNKHLKIVSNSMCGLNQHETNKNINKIASNISKEVVINKNY